jgi:hypothetical protein
MLASTSAVLVFLFERDPHRPRFEAIRIRRITPEISLIS